MMMMTVVTALMNRIVTVLIISSGAQIQSAFKVATIVMVLMTVEMDQMSIIAPHQQL
jgi:DNA-binding protein